MSWGRRTGWIPIQRSYDGVRDPYLAGTGESRFGAVWGGGGDGVEDEVVGREVEGPWGRFTLMEDGHLIDLIVMAWLAAKRHKFHREGGVPWQPGYAPCVAARRAGRREGGRASWDKR